MPPPRLGGTQCARILTLGAVFSCQAAARLLSYGRKHASTSILEGPWPAPRRRPGARAMALELAARARWLRPGSMQGNTQAECANAPMAPGPWRQLTGSRPAWDLSCKKKSWRLPAARGAAAMIRTGRLRSSAASIGRNRRFMKAIGGLAWRKQRGAWGVAGTRARMPGRPAGFPHRGHDPHLIAAVLCAPARAPKIC